MRRRLACALGVVAALCTWLAAPAVAVNTNPPPTHTDPPSSSVSGGSQGDPVHTQVQNCSLYANSSSFGLSCLGGGHGATATQTVKEYLKGDPIPGCWDDKISSADLVGKYELLPVPGQDYYLHTCVSGIAPDDLVARLHPDVSELILEIPVDAGPCPKPYTEAQTGTCLMSLTDHQQGLIDRTPLAGGQIPGITLLTLPSSRVRTNQATAFVDKAVAPGGSATATPHYQVGGVTMWAQMTGYRILPLGAGGPAVPCDGTADVAADDTPQSKPKACWWTYTASSADQPGQAYPFRAEAAWAVYYDDGTVHTLATFTKFAQVDLPVFDIQTIVVR